MPKYLIQGSYTSEGTKGLMRDGGTKRRAFIEQMISQAGGKVESFYFAYGKHDVYVIVDMPDAATALSTSLAVNAAGSVSLRTTPLITVEEMDQASKKQVGYKPPGAS